MSNKPIIYATCPAGCLWETVHKSDIEYIASHIEVGKDGEYHYLESGKEYKIFCSVSSVDLSFSASVGLLYNLPNDTDPLKFATLKVTNEDEYADGFVFKVLQSDSSYNDDNIASVRIVYEANGVRHIDIFNVNGNGAGYAVPKLAVSGATSVFFCNNQAQLVGVNGEDGADGKDGKSAYEYARDGGYTGTEEEFAAELANMGQGGSGGDADYYAHYNHRVHQLTADYLPESGCMDNWAATRQGNRSIAMLPLGVSVNRSDWEGGTYCEYAIAIMHPKTSGEVAIDAGAAGCGHVLVAKGVTHISDIEGINTVDLTLFTGNMPLPTLGTGEPNQKILVQKGRKEELAGNTNWSGIASMIEEVETW